MRITELLKKESIELGVTVSTKRGGHRPADLPDGCRRETEG